MALHRFGTAYGGFYYPGGLPGLDEQSVVYCVGAGEDISHDVEIASTVGCAVHIFDPTPRAIDYVHRVKDLLQTISQADVAASRAKTGELSCQDIINLHAVAPEKLVFHPVGIGLENGEAKFYKPTNPAYVSCSVIRQMKSDDYITVPMKDLQTAMRENGHSSIDLLKIDVEGIECALLDRMLQDGIYPTYLAVDFDLGWNGERMQDRSRCMETIEALKQNGYQQLHACWSDFSFVRKK